MSNIKPFQFGSTDENVEIRRDNDHEEDRTEEEEAICSFLSWFYVFVF